MKLIKVSQSPFIVELLLISSNIKTEDVAEIRYHFMEIIAQVEIDFINITNRLRI